MATKVKSAKTVAKKTATTKARRRKSNPKQGSHAFSFASELEYDVYNFLKLELDLESVEYEVRESLPNANDLVVAVQMADMLREEVVELIGQIGSVTCDGLDLIHAADDADFDNVAQGCIHYRKYGEGTEGSDAPSDK